MKFEVIDLGCDIKLYQTKTECKYKVLLASCFHGDERGALDIIFHYMLKNSEDDIQFSFIPIVNRYKTRMNEDNKNINCSFNHPLCKTTGEETKQGQAIISHIDLIKECARDGYASLHENIAAKHNYSHIWMQGEPSKEMIEELKIVDYNLCYNTLEDYLWHEGVKITACIEFVEEGRIRFMNNFFKYLRGLHENHILH
jgi:hypothetical protein